MKEHQCTKCGEIKPLTTEYFYQRKDTVFGYRKSCKVCDNIQRNKYKRTPSNNEYTRQWIKDNKNHVNEYRRNRYKDNTLYKLKTRLRNTLYRVKNFKAIRTMDYLGCNIEEFKLHIESQFKDNMTWDNHGEWHLDHIIPLSSAKTAEDLYKLCHYTNFQPLSAEENFKKSDKIFD